MYSRNSVSHGWEELKRKTEIPACLVTNISVNITPIIHWDSRDINWIEFISDWLMSLEHLDYLNSTHFNIPSSFLLSVSFIFKYFIFDSFTFYLLLPEMFSFMDILLELEKISELIDTSAKSNMCVCQTETVYYVLHCK